MQPKTLKHSSLEHISDLTKRRRSARISFSSSDHTANRADNLAEVFELSNHVSIVDASTGGLRLRARLTAEELRKGREMVKELKYLQIKFLDHCLQCSGQIRWFQEQGKEYLMGVELNSATQTVLRKVLQKHEELVELGNSTLNLVLVHPQSWVHEVVNVWFQPLQWEVQFAQNLEEFQKVLFESPPDFVLFDDRCAESLSEFLTIQRSHLQNVPTMLLIENTSDRWTESQLQRELLDIVARPVDIGDLAMRGFNLIMQSQTIRDLVDKQRKLQAALETVHEEMQESEVEADITDEIMQRLMAKTELFEELVPLQEALLDLSSINEIVAATQAWIQDYMSYPANLWHYSARKFQLLGNTTYHPTHLSLEERIPLVEAFVASQKNLQIHDHLVLVRHKNLILEVFDSITDNDHIAGLMLMVQLLGPVIALKQKDLQLQLQNEMTQRELELAHQLIVDTFQPKVERIPGLSHSILFTPYEQLGGDFFNIFYVGDDYYGMLIGDISGHGISAALLSVMFQSYFINLTTGLFSPSLVLNYVNEVSYPNVPSGHFASLCYSIYDTKSRTLCYSSAGFHEILLIRGGRVEALPASKNMLLGTFQNDMFGGYNEVEITLQTGDIFLFYTDAILEASKPQTDVMLGRDGVVKFLQSHSFETPDEITEALYNYGQQFSQRSGYQDDCTIMCFKVVS